MLKNHKRFLFILSIMLILFLAIGSISASENATDDFSLQADAATQDNAESLSADISDENILEETSGEVIGSKNEDVISNSENSTNIDGVYESTNVECSAVTQQYTSGNIVYKVKVYDIVSYEGVKHEEPKYNQIVKLRVYTGSNYKEYQGKVAEDGTAAINVPNLAIGTHKVEVYLGDDKKASSTIKIVKSTTKVYAPVKTIKHKKNTYYKIKVLDSYGNPVKKVVLKVKVYTGKKSKTYSIRTTASGIAKLKTKKLSLGTHKIVITTKNKNYKISKTTKIYIKKKVPKTAEKLSVSAPTSSVKVKESNYFTVTVKNSYADPVKKLTLKLKVYTGSKYKTYTVKTDTKGVAKLQTKNFALGTHKVSISTTNKNYKVSKSSKIIVKSTENVKLKTLLYYPSGNGYKAKLTWQSTSGHTYQVLKKTTGGYSVIGTVKATGSTASYHDTIGKNAKATYSVREVDGGYVIRSHDSEGLTLLSCPSVDVDFQNLKAVITWSKVANADKYRIFRKMGNDGEYKCIAVVDGKQTSYTDWYYQSSAELSKILNSDTFADQSFNNLHYTVRACSIDEVDGVEKVSYGLYLKDGDFNLETPTVISLKDNKITWGKVPNAEGYIILKKSQGSSSWQEIGRAAAKTSTQISLNIGTIDHNAYYAVQAYATKNGVKVYSDFDEGFTLKNNVASNSQYRVLYFGDSITFGSPYYSSTSIHVFSMPYRIAQLTGCVYYNPSIPGSTYHDLGVNPDGTNVENTDYYRYRITREVVDAIDAGQYPGNWEKLDSAKNSEGKTNTTIKDYNVVVLSAGTNDYLDNTVLGNIDDCPDNTTTFYGALNHILEKVKNASDARVAEGKTAIKVVFVDLFYSDRTNTYTERTNRDVTPNKIGLTLMDYQNALANELTKWAESGLQVFNFKTRDYNIVTSENCPYTASDNLHFTKFTYSQYGNAIAQFLIDNVFK